MTEIPKRNPQFVGQADARKNPTAETFRKEEFAVSPEQKLVAEAIHTGADAVSDQLTQARTEAGKKLQKLHGKELVFAGLKKVGLGLGIGWASETIGSLVLKKPGRRLGGFAGAQADVFYENIMSEVPALEELDEFQNMMREELPRFRGLLLGDEYSNFAQVGFDVGEQMGKDTGKFLGTETSGAMYGLLTIKSELPKLRWYDWALGQVGALLPELTTIHIKRFDLNLVNPTTVSGFLNVAKGLTEMVKERRA